MKELVLTYETFKTMSNLDTSFALTVYYTLQGDGTYIICCTGRDFFARCNVTDPADIIDFQNNFYATAVPSASPDDAFAIGYLGLFDGYLDNKAAASSEQTLDKRFAPITLGSPAIVNSSGVSTIYTPASGKKIRLKWLAMATPNTNSETVIVTITLSDKDIYIWPMGAPGAFMHSSLREGNVDGVLKINLSAAQTVYVNMDIEEF